MGIGRPDGSELPSLSPIWVAHIAHLHPRRPPMNETVPVQSEADLTASRRKRTFSAILDLAVQYPLLNHLDIAVMIGADAGWVKRLMSSDAFTALRVKRIKELHGPRLAEIQAKMETTSIALIETIAKRIANPEAPCTEDVLLKATALLLDRILPKEPAPINPGNPQPQVTQMNFYGLTAQDVLDARQKALSHGASVQLEAPIRKDTAVDVDEDGIPKERRVRGGESID